MIIIRTNEGAGNTHDWKWTMALRLPITHPKQWYNGLGMQIIVR